MNLLNSIGLYLPAFMLSAGLVSSRHVLAFLKTYQSQFENDPTTQSYLLKADDLWKNRGYHEFNSLLQLTFDTLTVLSGTVFWLYLFKTINFQGTLAIMTAGALSTSALFIVAHWLFPLIAQNRMPKSLAICVTFYSLLWSLFGWLGEAIESSSQVFLQKKGFYRRFKTIPEGDTAKIPANQTGLEENEAEMVQNIFSIGNTSAKEIFTPRVDIMGLDSQTSYSEVLAFIKNHRYTRVPVFKNNLDTIIGVLHIKDLLLLTDDQKGENFSLSRVVRPAYFVPRSKKVDDLMAEFKQGHIHMAIVVDEYGGTAGLITLEDILEEIVGEIQDEDDIEPPKVTQINESSYIIDPIILLADLNGEHSISIQTDEGIEIDTLGGYLQYLKGSIPTEGEVITAGPYHFEILKMDGQSIEKVKLNIHDPKQVTSLTDNNPSET